MHSTVDFHSAASNRFHQDLVDGVVENLSNPSDLRACCLISTKWLEGSRRRLFATVSLNTWNLNKWQRNIPPGPNGISFYVRSLTLRQARSVVLLEPETLTGIMDHLTSFRRLKTLVLQDVNFEDLFGERSLTQCFGYFGTSVDALRLHGIKTDMSTLLFFINLFPNLKHLTIGSPKLSSEVAEAPDGDLSLRGTLQLDDLGDASQTLLQGILLVPLHLEEISITNTNISDTGTLDRIIEMCIPTLKKLEIDQPNTSQVSCSFVYRTSLS